MNAIVQSQLEVYQRQVSVKLREHARFCQQLASDPMDEWTLLLITAHPSVPPEVRKYAAKAHALMALQREL